MQKVIDLLAKFVKHGEKLSFFANLVITVVNGATKWLEENWLLCFGWLLLILLPYVGYAIYFLLFEWNWLPDSNNCNMKSFENDR